MDCSFKIALTVYLAAAAWFEHRWRLLPNWLTLPAMGMALWCRAFTCCFGSFPKECMEGVLGVIMIWVWLYVGWLLRFYGAGDAKLLMAMSALFPTIEWLWVLCASIVAVGGAALLVKYRGNLRQVGDFYLAALLTRQLHPTEAERERADFPLAFPIAIAGVIYAWLLA